MITFFAASNYPLSIFMESPAAGFVLSYVMNLVFFGILGYVFIRPQIRKSTLHRYLIAMLAMTMAAMAANLVPFYLFGIAGVASFVPHFVVNFCLLAIISYALAWHHFKAPVNRSAIIGLVMAVLTNAYLLWLVF